MIIYGCVRRFASALLSICMRSAFSCAGGTSGLPKGYLMLFDSMMRLTPMDSATGVMLHHWTMGMPAFSNSLVITAPQRVDVPQVEVRMAASMP